MSLRPTAPAADAEASFAAIKQAVIDRTGHHYYVDKDHLLRDRLAKRISVSGCRGMADYLALLSHADAGPAEWRELESEVTIGETFFFRHTEQFAALQTVILPAIIARNAGTRRLTIWSAGCALGAEPYSVAILLDRLLGEAIGGWSIDILGSDISHRVLDKAQGGCFGNWALRGMPDEERARNFIATDDARQWRIADRHRRHVRFVQHNLLGLLDTASAKEWRGFDLILCRNVLIYFNPERIAPMMSALGRCLGSHGWLIVGYSDAIAGLPPDLGVVELPGTIAFRPPGLVPPRFADAALPASPAMPIAAERDALVAPKANGPQVAARQPRLPSVPSASASARVSTTEAGRPPPALAVIRALADAGRLQEARRACAEAIDAHPLDARLHFYDGVVAQAAGERARAEAALRRALYLAGDMVMAHYHLGLLLLDGAAPLASRGIMAEVVRLCRALPETEVLPESDGLTPRALIERIEMRLRARPAEARPAGARPDQAPRAPSRRAALPSS